MVEFFAAPEYVKVLELKHLIITDGGIPVAERKYGVLEDVQIVGQPFLEKGEWWCWMLRPILIPERERIEGQQQRERQDAERVGTG